MACSFAGPVCTKGLYESRRVVDQSVSTWHSIPITHRPCEAAPFSSARTSSAVPCFPLALLSRKPNPSPLLLTRSLRQIQENCIRRPSVCQSKSLLKAKILGSIGGGPFELLRAFRKMHCGRGTVRKKT